MTIFTIIGISACVILGTLLVGIIIASIIFSGDKGNDAAFYAFMFFGSWVTSTVFLILQLINPLLGK